ncbi:hypothetical protein [Micromonospora sp. WMMD1274]|uniref:hypothetical protein n=1 Tax=Micromonospora sp. WMMD1274 TaxID=3404116 RepID=UPI003B945BD3
MSSYQTVIRPSGPLTAEVLVGLLADLGEQPPRRIPRPYTRTASVGGARRGHVR